MPATATGPGSLAMTSDHTVPVAGMARSYLNEQPFVAAGRPPNRVPLRMKAIAINDFGGPEQLQLVERPMPPITDEQVLVAVRVAAVNPIDWRIRQGQLKQFVPYEFPAILGREVSGVVAQVGAAVRGFAVGDAVFGFLQQRLMHWGGYAEYVPIEAAKLAHKPAKSQLRAGGGAAGGRPHRLAGPVRGREVAAGRGGADHRRRRRRRQPGRAAGLPCRGNGHRQRQPGQSRFRARVWAPPWSWTIRRRISPPPSRRGFRPGWT